jgi:hypothetical protein
MTVIEHYKRALGNIAGEWHARRLPDGERFGCSCPEFAREMLDTAPPDDTQGAVEAERQRIVDLIQEAAAEHPDPSRARKALLSVAIDIALSDTDGWR